MNKEKILIAVGVVALAGLSYRVGVMSANRAQANNITVKQSTKQSFAKDQQDRVMQKQSNEEQAPEKTNTSTKSQRLNKIVQDQHRAKQIAKLYHKQKYAITGLIGRSKIEKEIAAELIANGYSDFTLKDIDNINYMRKKNDLSIEQAVKAYVD